MSRLIKQIKSSKIEKVCKYCQHYEGETQEYNRGKIQHYVNCSEGWISKKQHKLYFDNKACKNFQYFS